MPWHRSLPFSKRNRHDIVRALRGREETSHRYELHRRNAGVEQRSSYSLDELVGLEHPAASSVILGFSAQGEHMIAYACHSEEGDGDSFGDMGCLEYVLEFWRFNFHSPLVCTGRIPLFRCSDGTNFGLPEFAECQHAKICMVESLHPPVLLVAGCGSFSEEDSEEQPSRRESISVLMGHSGGMDSLPEGDILVLHLTYLKRPPYPPLHLSRCLVSGGDSGCPLPLSVALNTGDTIRVVTVVDKFAPRLHEPFGNEHDLEARLARLSARGGEEECERMATVQGCFDAEEYLSHLLCSLKSSSQLPPGTYHVADYDLELLEASSDSFAPLRSPGPDHAPAEPGGAGGCAAVGLVAVLQGAPGSEEPHVMVGHLVLLCLATGAVLHRVSTRVQRCHPHVLAAPSPLAARFAGSWKAALHEAQLQAHRARNLRLLDNDSVHRGKSLPVLPNPCYPVDITPPS